MILVIGATGQLGLALVSRLRKRGAEVTALVRPPTDPASVRGARIVRGDLRDPASLRGVCDGVQTVFATANAIVPRPGERADYDAIAEGYAELGRIARAAGVERFVFMSVPRQLMGHGAPDFDAKATAEAALAAEGPPLTVVRSSLFMELWLPWLGSRLPTRGGRQATLERGFWLTRVMGATAQQSLDRFGLALVLGNGSARHSFIALDDVAGALAAATGEDGEIHLGGPEVLSWREVADIYGRVLGRRVRAIPQPTAPLRALATAARPLSPATSQLLAAGALVATVDTDYPPDAARRLLGRDPISAEDFLSRAHNRPCA